MAKRTKKDDEWVPLEYRKITQRPQCPPKIETIVYNPHVSKQMGGLEDWIPDLLARVTFEGNYVHDCVIIRHVDGSSITWRRI